MTGTSQPVETYPPSPGEADGVSTAQLVSQLAEELSRLARNEFKLARMRLQHNGKRAGLGAGTLGGAGAMAAYGGACLVAAAIIALALVMPAWAAAIVVGVVLLVGAAIAGLVGRKTLRSASPGSVPKETLESLSADVHTLLEHARR
jgi:Putative Actinobacterial Holin-X, holin superfamily III